MTARKAARKHQAEIIGRYRDGETLTALAARFDVSYWTIRNWLIEWGVPRRGRVALDQTVIIPKDKGVRGYLAGLIDGEGSITIQRPKRDRERESVLVTVASTTRELHDWLLTTIGGKVYERRINHLGKKPVWYWHVGRARDVRALLRATMPYMIIKREAAQRALVVVNEQVKNSDTNRAEAVMA